MLKVLLFLCKQLLPRRNELLDLEIKATVLYLGMTCLGILVAILLSGSPDFSLDLLSLILAIKAVNLSLLVYPIVSISGGVVSIMGFHEVCHCLYCLTKGVRIMDILRDWKHIGIEVEEPHPHGLPLSSLISIPVVTLASAISLPLWIMAFNIAASCLYCRDDIRHFLRERKSPRMNETRVVNTD